MNERAQKPLLQEEELAKRGWMELQNCVSTQVHGEKMFGTVQSRLKQAKLMDESKVRRSRDQSLLFFCQ